MTLHAVTHPSSCADPDVVKAIEELLALAKEGRARAVVLVWDSGRGRSDGSKFNFAGAADADLPVLIYGIERVKFNLLAKIAKLVDDEDEK